MLFKNNQGFTIIEILVTIFIIAVVVTGIFGLFVLNIRTSQEAERRVIATALANERAEMIRNLPYASVGTQGGIPAGAIVPNETIVRSGTSYTINTDIRYIDDAFDGLVTSNPPDLLNTDYKQARIEVGWSGPSVPLPLVLLMQIVPPGVEGGTSEGTLSFQALNATGQGVSGASVRVVNTSLNPTIDSTTQTDSNGRVLLPGMPVNNGSYELTVSKSGFNTEQTYDATSSFIPDSDHAHLSMIAGQLTEKTFFIDEVSTVEVQTKIWPQNQPLAGVAYTLRGTKTIGTDSQNQPVYIVDQANTTNSNGVFTHTGLIWDSYTLAMDGVATGYDIKETSVLLPMAVNPGSSTEQILTLVEHQPISLHVTVANPQNQPIDNATVRLFHASNGYDEALGTGVNGQVYFPGNPANPTEDIPENSDYIIEITAPGYEAFTSTVTISNTTAVRVELTSVSP